MASHRKSRPRTLTSHGSRTAVGLSTAALASFGLLSQTAQAAPGEPKQSVEEVQKKVDELYRQAGTATQEYNEAKERTDKQRTKSDRLIDDVAKRTQKLNEARRLLGSYAATQYRNGGMDPTATLLLASDPQDYFDQNHMLDRMTGRQKQAVTDFQTQQATATEKRAEATESLAQLNESQNELRTSKESVQGKLAKARELLSDLTAEEKARLAALERKREQAAQRKAEELAREQAEKQREERERNEGSGSSDGGTSTPGSGTGADSGTYATKAAKALAFARAQIGKPYVWGATGPNSYDCSGLTQGAWKAAGVSLPRTTWDQVKVGSRIATEDLKPGDLVFFYDDISHVGLYIGDGQMIHAPKPGANVRTEAITFMPIYGSVRPA
ncbi:NlpC/P60 family protein [Streptomyces sp. NPDC004647]|uniref:C40 family peptidase n=1 Tax=Streptomyces sp. NPDC004647 TaxID=3154671 RepID=UPI0033A54B04